MAKRRIAVLGSTGSIGTQTLDVVRQHGDKLEIVGLAVNSSLDVLLAQAREFGVRHLAVGNAALANDPRCDEARALVRSLAVPEGQEDAEASFGVGSEAVVALTQLPEVDVVVNALVGAAGLEASYTTLKAGKVLALANKESLVVGGDLIMPLAAAVDADRRASGVAPATGPAGALMPIDSEHGAIYQCLLGENPREISKLWVTASGGPFRGKTIADLEAVTPAQALAHPTWNMGAKISIDSSTLMNKGLEVIEASRLFDVPPERIDVTVHPQSIVHSMVEFVDGATICQASPPDMRLPIALGLSAPDRMTNVAAACDWTKAATWTFEPLDDEAFPAVQLARHCLAASEKHTAVLNAANEQAVHAFLEHRLPYLGIVDTVKVVLDQMDAELRGNPLFTDVEEMNQLELEARRRADNLINKQ